MKNIDFGSNKISRQNNRSGFHDINSGVDKLYNLNVMEKKHYFIKQETFLFLKSSLRNLKESKISLI